jgi:hypothetical protein
MNYETLELAVRTFGRRRPFRPYVIEFVNGNRVIVKHPEAVRPQPQYLYFVDPHSSDYQVFDHTGVCRVLDIPDDGTA